MKIKIDVPIVTKVKQEVELPLYVKGAPYTTSLSPSELELIRVDESLYVRRYTIQHHTKTPVITVDYSSSTNAVIFLENIFHSAASSKGRYEIISEVEFKSILDKVLYE